MRVTPEQIEKAKQIDLLPEKSVLYAPAQELLQESMI